MTENDLAINRQSDCFGARRRDPAATPSLSPARFQPFRLARERQGAMIGLDRFGAVPGTAVRLHSRLLAWELV